MATRAEDFLKNEQDWEEFIRQNKVESEGVIHIADLGEEYSASAYVAPVMFPVILKTMKDMDAKAFVSALMFINEGNAIEIERITPAE